MQHCRPFWVNFKKKRKKKVVSVDVFLNKIFFFSFVRGQVSLHANICDLVLSVEPERGLGLESCKVKSMKKTT